MSITEIVNTFYRLNNAVPVGKASLDDLQALLADDFVFTGPLMQVKGAAQFVGLLRQFMPFHESVTVMKQFSGQEEVCSITELQLKTPAGGALTVDVAKVIQVKDGKIASLTLYYDPRGFAAAFPMP
jgi:ketosteroid isomerase-like protein